MAQKQDVGRLALRVEGEFWNAYYALKQDTMDGAILLASIRLSAVMGDDRRKLAFMRMMQDMVAEIIEGATGMRPSWGAPHTAPERERSGSA